MERDKLNYFIQNKEYAKVRELLLKQNLVNISEFLSSLDDKNLLLVYRILPKDLAAKVFSYFDLDTRGKLANSFTNSEIRDLITNLNLDDIVDFLEEVPANVVQRFIMNSNPENRELINKFLKYPQDSAGSLMTIEYIELKENISVKDALDFIRINGRNKETIYTCYITDIDKKLRGTITLENLVLSKDNDKLSDIMHSQDIISVSATNDKHYVAQLFQKYDLLSIPVVDNESRILGIITVDDILDVIEEINTEDVQKMGAIYPLDTDYIHTSAFKMAKSRITWLLILMISSYFTASIIFAYENSIAKFTILTSFIPLLMDTAGNAGSQSSTMIIRELALGRVKVSNFLSIVLKEFSISILVGILLALVNFLRLMYMDFSLQSSNIKTEIAFLVSLTLFLTVIIAKIIGGILPVFAKVLNLDPALMAGPLITTIADVISLLIYFSLANLILMSYF